MQNGQNGNKNQSNINSSSISKNDSVKSDSMKADVQKSDQKTDSKLETKSAGATIGGANAIDSKIDGKKPAASDTVSRSSDQDSQNLQKNDQQQDVAQQDGSKGNFDLSSIIPEFSNEDLGQYRQKVMQYAEEKPLQTVGWAVAGGALLGWLLISKQGQAVLRTAASIAVPLVSSVIAKNGGLQQMSSQITGQQSAVTHH